MTGTASLSVRHAENRIWGPHVFLEATGDPEAIRDAYAREAAGWPQRHFALVEPTPEALDPWYRLGFAQMHAYGERESGAERSKASGIAIRHGGPADLEAALRIDRVIHDLQEASPSFASVPLDEAARRADWEETLASEDVSYFVAERDGDPVGHVTVYPENEATMNLASTAVLPAAQGHGVGRALASYALAFARESGHATVATNWRVTNLVASRFWPALGFRVTKLRLSRELPR
jgi:ribosomal protein S18 acetylase RimI-like enzyme